MGGPAAIRLSVVVPVYRVPGYLGACLDSILHDAPPGVEVVAVDDASPDECGRLLDEYAQREERLRVVHLDRNGGSGPARNAGLERASGEYVWFVDSDDWLAPGAVAAVLARLAQAQPDVLLVDHVRVQPDGRAVCEPSSDRLRAAAGTHPGPLRDQPILLRVQHLACNRVVRRTLLDELGLRFSPGWYEDVPFSHQLLIAAERVAVLDRVCYLYRQRDDGSITRTADARHFDVFGQYERLFEVLDSWAAAGVEDDFRPLVFELMISHLLVVTGGDARVPAHLRAEFFGRVVGHYRRYRPTGGYRVPPGVLGLKHRLVRFNAYPAYATLRAGYRAVLTRGRRGRRRRPDAMAPSGAAGLP